MHTNHNVTFGVLCNLIMYRHLQATFQTSLLVAQKTFFSEADAKAGSSGPNIMLLTGHMPDKLLVAQGRFVSQLSRRLAKGFSGLNIRFFCRLRARQVVSSSSEVR